MWKTLGFVVLLFAVVYADEEREQSKCEEDRERRLSANDTGPLHMVPECEENGDYAALQCFTNHGWCMCYRRNGEPIGTPSKDTKACKCVRERDDAKTAGGGFKPSCSKDGTYKPTQCIEQDCWCVDKDGKATSEVQLKKDISCDRDD